jgi:opacity protein-like surface antigen
MKSFLLIAVALSAASLPAQAASMKAYKCAAAHGPAAEFPLYESGDAFRAASSMGSTRYFDLEKIPTGDLAGWPVFQGGTYYRGGNDLWVILPGDDALEVIKPLENLPEGQRYLCARTL